MRQLIKLCVTGISVVLLMLAFIPTNLLTFGDRLVCGSIGFLIFVICQPLVIFRLLMWLRDLIALIVARIHDCSQSDSEDFDPLTTVQETAVQQEMAPPPKVSPEVKLKPIPEHKPTMAIETPIKEGHANARIATATVVKPPLNDKLFQNEVVDDTPPDMFAHIRGPEVMAHYIALDIETTGFSRENDRIIEIAAIHYVYDAEVERFHSYVNPQMQIPKHITELTGIRQSDVDTAPMIDDIAGAFRKFIKTYPIVGHNVSDFDWPFLTAHMMLDKPSILIDTLDMSRSAFPLLPSHKLSHLNYWFDLDDGTSHRADADAAAANALMWVCLYSKQYESQYQMAIRHGIPKSEYTPKPKSRRHFQKVSIADIKPSAEGQDQPGPLFGKKVVFTGELSISRNDAMQLAVNAGALLRTSVSSKTDFLVVGKQDLSVVGADGMSGKEEKAHEVNASGKGCVRIIDEAEFMTLLTKVPDLDTID